MSKNFTDESIKIGKFPVHNGPDGPLYEDDDPGKPPCAECGAMTQEESGTMCICSGDKDHCHGVDLWP